ncbi:MAG TPA: YtxH domain-containing protein [Candidatus Eisenbacteria bacterium]|nr:YtxH domain-containing protein [Candidatus Eisenbacteria bacterium]
MNDQRHHGGGFFNGFVLGLIIGAGLVFLFGTSKGKRVLQMLLDQVEENTAISELLEMPEDEEDDFVMDARDEEPVEEHRHIHEEESSTRPVAKVKRFFRGSKKLVS